MAGSDSGGGAGLQADLKALQAFGVHGCTVVAAVTAQNSVAVTRVDPISAELLDAQLAALAADMPPAAIKTGLLGSADNLRVVCRWVDHLRAQVEKLGLSIGGEPVWADARFEEATDPFSKEVSLVAVWRGGERFGKATFFPDGRVFAEYQVLLPHPERPDSYVDSVQIWGRPQQLRGDAVVADYLK